MCIPLEKLDIILNKLAERDLIKLHKHDTEEFDRTRKFNIFQKEYKIVWYKNLCTLYIDDTTEIKFHYLTVNGFYPNLYKTNLNFKYNDDTICIIPLQIH